jgi:hypothetical protein
LSWESLSASMRPAINLIFSLRKFFNDIRWRFPFGESD